MYSFRWHVYSSKDRACSAEVYREDEARIVAQALTAATGYEHEVFDMKERD